MKKIIIFLLIINGISRLAYTQQGNQWIVGTYDGAYMLQFNGSGGQTAQYKIPFPNNQIFFLGQHSNICDSLGNLLFSCDGTTIYDKHFNVMQGGDSIISRQYHKNYLLISAQLSIILPVSATKYYVIIPIPTDSLYDLIWGGGVVAQYYNEIWYAEVDMSLNGGNGAVVKKRVPVIKHAKMALSNLAACRHANGKDWWLLKKGKDSNKLYTLLVTKDSIYDKGIQSFAEPLFGNWDNFGQCMFNEQGTQFVSCVGGAGAQDTINNASDTFCKGYICVMDFDRCTGLLYNPKVYKTKAGTKYNDPTTNINATAGICFSPNGRFVYVNDFYNIKQLDLWDNDTNTQWTMVFGPKNDGLFSTMYVGKDNKIYIGNTSNAYKYATVIDSPNVNGIGCSVCYQCLTHVGAITGYSAPPNVPNYDLGKLEPCWPVSSEEIGMMSDEIAVYPNPTSGKLIVKNAQGKTKELYNTIGQLMLRIYENEIDVSSFARGVYYLRCDGQVKKVILE